MDDFDSNKIVSKNFKLGVAQEGLWGLATGFFTPSTILPLALVDLGQSASMVGLLAALYSLGTTLPQIFSALFLPPKFTNPKQLAWLHLPAILGPLISGLGFVLAPSHSQFRLLSIFFGFTLHALGIGLVGPHWVAGMGRNIPEGMRGRYFGISFFASSLGGTLTGLIASKWVSSGGNNWGYALAFFASVPVMVASVIVLSRLQPIAPPPKKPLQNIFSVGLGLIKERLVDSSSFRMGIGLTIVMILVDAPGNLFTVYLREKAQFASSWFELFTPSVALGGMLGSFCLGNLLDKFGLRFAFLAAFFSGLGSLLTIILGHFSIWPAFAFVCSGFLHSAFPVITQVMNLKLAGKGGSTLEVGLFNSLMGPWTFITPLLSGWVASSAGYNPVFYSGIFCCLIGFLFLGKKDI